MTPLAPRSPRVVRRARTLALAAALALLAAPVASSQPIAATAPFVTEPMPAPPTLRVLQEEPGAVTYEFTATWPVSLADAVAAATGSDRTSEFVATAVAQGHTTMSQSVELGAAVPPAVLILAADAERVPLPAASDGWDAWQFPAAEVGALGTVRRRMVGSVDVHPIHVEGGELVRYRRLVVRVPRPPVQATLATRGAGGNPHVGVTRSVLADGTWFKIPIRTHGVYRLTAAYLRDSLGVASPDLARVQVYGNGGRRLPRLAGAPRTPDLAEVPTLLTGDAVYFYAEGPSWWDWRPGVGTVAGYWEHDISPFSDDAYYFVRVDAPNPVRLQPVPFVNAPNAIALPTVEARLFHEDDLFNLERDGGGSGLDWMGELLPRGNAPLTVLDEMPSGVDPSAQVRYRIAVAARASSTSTVSLTAGGATAAPVLAGVSLGAENTGDLMRLATVSLTGTAGSTLAVSARASGGGSGAQNWLDWVEAVVDRAPVVGAGGVLQFPSAPDATVPVEYTLGGFSSEPQVWDVSTPGAITRLGVQAANGAWRVQVSPAESSEGSGSPREIVAFDPAGSDVRLPRRGQPVANQNLHGLTDTPSYVVVTHPLFAEQANRLAQHRQSSDGLTPLVVTVDQVQNEFGGGSPDMVAIRDFVKFLADRVADPEQAPRSLLLFGDGHYDFRNIDSNLPWFVPVFETENMINRVRSYTTDDFFALLDDTEGTWTPPPGWPAGVPYSEFMDLAVGRLTVTTAQQAADVVTKILHYETPETWGQWRQRVTYLADDQYPNYWDQDIHVLNANVTANTHATSDSTVIVQKIFGPSYPEVNAAGGRRRPQATDAIVRGLNDGTLLWNYSGHGGIDGLGDEQYFTRGILDQLTNFDRLAIFVTATCSFGRYDMSERQSLAEDTFVKPDGGAVALFTTVRVVYTGGTPDQGNNFGLNVELARQMGIRGADGRPRRLGEILLSLKQTTTGASENNRKFNLLGDPAMRLGLPDGDIALAPPPTLVAYQEATINGSVLTPLGAPDPTFDGVVELEVFDAERDIEMPQTATPCSASYTPCQYTGGRYRDRVDRLYSGRASVRGGQFSATFRVPQDVSYSGQQARVVAYARGAGTATAGGSSVDAVVATTAGTRPDDASGPAIRLFFGDTTFVSGGMTGRTPTLIARLSDPSGINTVGAGVGHQLLVTIDGDPTTAFDVGRYYTGDVDTYRSGTLRVPLPALAPGPHTLTLTAWDAVNNASTAEIQFVVSDAEGLDVRNALPYPNPTAGPTRFTFEHNQAPGTAARVQVRIFTLAGRPVRTLRDTDALPSGVLGGPLVQIPWDGRDEDGVRLASGIYLYRLRVEVDAADGGTDAVERIDRLAIIR